MDDGSSRAITPRLLFGLLAALAGALLLLQRFGLVGDLDLSSWWPLGVIALGLVQVFWAQNALSRVAGLFVAAVGGLLLLARLRPDLLELETVLESLWPLALLLGGLFIALRALRPNALSTSSVGAEDRSRGFVMCAGQERRSTSQSYRGGELTAFMGGYELDLREASTDAEGAVLDVLAVMGGIEVKIPRDWRVSLELTAVMGAAVDKTSGPEGTGGGGDKVLRIRGLVVMGGVEVKD